MCSLIVKDTVSRWEECRWRGAWLGWAPSASDTCWRTPQGCSLSGNTCQMQPPVKTQQSNKADICFPNTVISILYKFWNYGRISNICKILWGEGNPPPQYKVNLLSFGRKMGNLLELKQIFGGFVGRWAVFSGFDCFTLSNGFCLAGSISWPAASIHWLTATSSLSLMIRMYSSAFWLPFYIKIKINSRLKITHKICDWEGNR